MAKVLFHKVASLPGTLEANSFYYVENGDYAESYITDDAGVAKAMGNSVMIQEIATEILSGNAFRIVADIAARDAIVTGSTPFMVLVADVTADPTVDLGGALYAWEPGSPGSYLKVAEYESMDITLEWSDIQNGPSSTPAQIDAAVSASHTHSNKTDILDNLSEDGDDLLTFNGELVGVTQWTTLDW